MAINAPRSTSVNDYITLVEDLARRNRGGGLMQLYDQASNAPYVVPGTPVDDSARTNKVRDAYKANIDALSSNQNFTFDPTTGGYINNITGEKITPQDIETSVTGQVDISAPDWNNVPTPQALPKQELPYVPQSQSSFNDPFGSFDDVLSHVGMGRVQGAATQRKQPTGQPNQFGIFPQIEKAVPAPSKPQGFFAPLRNLQAQADNLNKGNNGLKPPSYVGPVVPFDQLKPILATSGNPANKAGIPAGDVLGASSQSKPFIGPILPGGEIDAKNYEKLGKEKYIQNELNQFRKDYLSDPASKISDLDIAHQIRANLDKIASEQSSEPNPSDLPLRTSLNQPVKGDVPNPGEGVNKLATEFEPNRNLQGKVNIQDINPFRRIGDASASLNTALDNGGKALAKGVNALKSKTGDLVDAVSTNITRAIDNTRPVTNAVAASQPQKAQSNVSVTKSAGSSTGTAVTPTNVVKSTASSLGSAFAPPKQTPKPSPAPAPKPASKPASTPSKSSNFLVNIFRSLFG